MLTGEDAIHLAAAWLGEAKRVLGFTKFGTRSCCAETRKDLAPLALDEEYEVVSSICANIPIPPARASPEGLNMLDVDVIVKSSTQYRFWGEPRVRKCFPLSATTAHWI